MIYRCESKSVILQSAAHTLNQIWNICDYKRRDEMRLVDGEFREELRVNEEGAVGESGFFFEMPVATERMNMIRWSSPRAPVETNLVPYWYSKPNDEESPVCQIKLAPN